jgi:predicted kinase
MYGKSTYATTIFQKINVFSLESMLMRTVSDAETNPAEVKKQ